MSEPFFDYSFSSIEIDSLDLDAGAIAISRLAAYVEDKQLPLQVVKRIAREDMQERFETETAPDGSKWFDLEENYAEEKQRKVGFEHPILTRHTPLRTAATREEAWSVTAESIFFNTGKLPDYWRLHQEGSEDFGAFYHSTANPTGASKFDEDQGQNVPPRPFIGLSADAEARALDTFYVWFEGGLENVEKRFFVSGSGILHHRVKGRIGPQIPF